jgi:hypothetical protein
MSEEFHGQRKAYKNGYKMALLDIRLAMIPHHRDPDFYKHFQKYIVSKLHDFDVDDINELLLENIKYQEK